MLINTHIGFDATDGMGIDGAVFQRELLELDAMGKTAIQVWINSPGGVVVDGYNIFNAILKSKTPVDTYNCGIAASIAGVIFMAGRKRIMADYASLMMHNPFGGDDKKQINAMKDSLVTMLSAKSHIAETEVNFLMDRTTWLNSAECFAKGFCTEIEVTSENNKKRMPVLNAEDISTVTATWKASNLIVNSIFSTQQTENFNMKKVYAKLGLVEGTNEDSVNAAIDVILNRATTAEKLAGDTATELTTVKNELTTVKTENQTLKTAAAAAKTKEENATKAANVTVLNSILDKAVIAGKIKADQKAKWVEKMDTIGLEEIKDLIENLPLNKVANKALTVDTTTGDGLKNVAGKAMAAVRDKIGL